MVLMISIHQSMILIINCVNTKELNFIYKFLILFIISLWNRFNCLSYCISVNSPKCTISFKYLLIPPTAFTEADLGALYSNANSPKASPDFKVFLISLFMMIWHYPLSIKKYELALSPYLKTISPSWTVQ
jgi:hypothetical protein